MGLVDKFKNRFPVVGSGAVYGGSDGGWVIGVALLIIAIIVTLLSLHFTDNINLFGKNSSETTIVVQPAPVPDPPSSRNVINDDTEEAEEEQVRSIAEQELYAIDNLAEANASLSNAEAQYASRKAAGGDATAIKFAKDTVTQRTAEVKVAKAVLKVAVAATEEAAKNAEAARKIRVEGEELQAKLSSPAVLERMGKYPYAESWAIDTIKPGAGGTTKNFTMWDGFRYSAHVKYNESSALTVFILDRRLATIAEIAALKSTKLGDDYDMLPIDVTRWNLTYWKTNKELPRNNSWNHAHAGRDYKVWDLTWDTKHKSSIFMYNYNSFAPGSDKVHRKLGPGTYKVVWPMKISKRMFVVPYICTMNNETTDMNSGFVGNQGKWVEPTGAIDYVEFKFIVPFDMILHEELCNNISIKLVPEANTTGRVTMSTPIVGKVTAGKVASMVGVGSVSLEKWNVNM